MNYLYRDKCSEDYASPKPTKMGWHLVMLLLSALLLSSNAFAQTCPDLNCTSNDVKVERVYLTDANGNMLSSACTPGEPVQAYLNVVVSTNTPRVGVYLSGTLKVSGMADQSVANCFGVPLTGNSNILRYPTSINWTCGSGIMLVDIFIAWGTGNKNFCLDPTTCSSIVPSKCRREAPIVVEAPLIAQFTTQAACTEANEFETVTFTSTTTGGKTPYTYAWDFNNDGITDATTQTASHTYLSGGEKTVKLTVTDASTPANVDSHTSIITVNSCCATPSITTQPTPQSACTGDNVSFTVAATGGNPAPAYQWQVDMGAGFVDLTDGGKYAGVNTATLDITGVTADMHGFEYRVVLQSGVCPAATSDAASLTINAAAMLSALENVTNCQGAAANAMFTTTVSGLGASAANVVWYKGDAVLADGEKYDITVSGDQSILTVTALVPADAGTYKAVLTGAECGMPETSATLTVNTTATLTNPGDLTKCEGEDVVITTTIGGTGALSANVKWYKVVNSDEVEITAGISTTATTSTLTLTGITADDAGMYAIRMVDAECGTPSEAFTLSVNTGASLSDLVAVTRCVGESASFMTTVSGAGANAANVKWYKGVTLLSDGGNYSIEVDGNTSTLTISNLETTDSGTYKAVLENAACGSPEKSAMLSVYAIPMQPQVNVTQPNCQALYGTIEVTAPVSEGMVYSINGVDYQSGNIFTNLAPGNYTVTAKNRGNCVSAGTSVTIDPLPKAPEPEVTCHLINFTNERKGLISTLTTPAGPVPVFGNKRNPDGTYAPENHAAIFDTQAPTGDDTDLYTVDWYHVLIINQDQTNVPNDNQWGGELLLDFSQIGPVTMTSMRALDIDGYENNSWVYLYGAGGNELYKVQLQNLGNNSRQTVDLGNTKGVMSMKIVLDGRDGPINLAGSGAFDDIRFCIEEEVENPCDIQPLASTAASQAVAYPSPFSDRATVEFTLAKGGEYVANLYDMRGNLLKELRKGNAQAGEVMNVEVDGRNLLNGIYIARIVSGSEVKTVKLILRK